MLTQQDLEAIRLIVRSEVKSEVRSEVKKQIRIEVPPIVERMLQPVHEKMDTILKALTTDIVDHEARITRLEHRLDISS